MRRAVRARQSADARGVAHVAGVRGPGCPARGAGGVVGLPRARHGGLLPLRAAAHGLRAGGARARRRSSASWASPRSRGRWGGSTSRASCCCRGCCWRAPAARGARGWRGAGGAGASLSCSASAARTRCRWARSSSCWRRCARCCLGYAAQGAAARGAVGTRSHGPLHPGRVRVPAVAAAGDDALAPPVMAGTPGHSAETLGRGCSGSPCGARQPGDTSSSWPLPSCSCSRRRCWAAAARVYPRVLAGLLPVAGGGLRGEAFAVRRAAVAARLRDAALPRALPRPRRALPRGTGRAGSRAVGAGASLGRPWKRLGGGGVRPGGGGLGVQVAASQCSPAARRWCRRPAAADSPSAGPRQPLGAGVLPRRSTGAPSPAARPGPCPCPSACGATCPRRSTWRTRRTGTARRVEWTPNRLRGGRGGDAAGGAARQPELAPGLEGLGGRGGVARRAARRAAARGPAPRGAALPAALGPRRRGGVGARVGGARARWRGARRGAGSTWGPKPWWGAVPLVAWASAADGVARAGGAPVLRNPDGSPLQGGGAASGRAAPGRALRGAGGVVAAEVPSAPDADGIVHTGALLAGDGAGAPLGRHLRAPRPAPGASGRSRPCVRGRHLLLPRAPRAHAAARRVAVSTKGWAPGEWKVLVGLWYAGGDGSLIGARGPRAAPHRVTRGGRYLHGTGEDGELTRGAGQRTAWDGTALECRDATRPGRYEARMRILHTMLRVGDLERSSTSTPASSG